MKYLIIVQNRNVHLVDWRRFSDLKHQLIIITSSDGAKGLKEIKQDSQFAKIIETRSFKGPDLTNLVREILSTVNIKPGEDEILIATNDEQALIPCCEVREALGLPGNRVKELLPFRDKTASKAKLTNLKELLPNYIQYDPIQFLHNEAGYIEYIEKYLGYPIFAKPIDDGGSRRTSTIHNRKDLIAWCKATGNDNKFELDQFIHGTLFHCDSIMKDNKILFFCVGKNSHPCADFSSGKTTASIPLLESDPDYTALKEFNSTILAALDPVPNGCTHLEVFKMADGSLKFLEIAARSPGAMIPEMYATWLGINFREAQLKLQLGMNYTPQATPGPYAAWIWYPEKTGVVSKLTPPTDLESKCHIEWRRKLGEAVQKPKDLIDYACAMMLTHSDYSQLQHDFVKMSHDYEIYDVTPLSARNTAQRPSLEEKANGRKPIENFFKEPETEKTPRSNSKDKLLNWKKVTAMSGFAAAAMYVGWNIFRVVTAKENPTSGSQSSYRPMP